MTDRPAQSPDRINAKTSKTVADAIGVRLRTDVPAEMTELPVRLQILLDQLRAQDATAEDASRPPPVSGISNWS